MWQMAERGKQQMLGFSSPSTAYHLRPTPKANGFDRTEATDLLKTKDGARDRTQYEPILERR